MCPQARFHLPPELGGLIRSDFERVIEQSNIGKENEQIAKLYFVDKMPQIDVAAELDITRKTVGRRLPYIMERMQNTSRQLYS